LIPQCAKQQVNICDDAEIYSDDDTEEGDNITYNTNRNEDNLWMGYGGVDEGKGNNKPIYEIKDIGTYLNECGYEKDKDYIMEELDTSDDAEFNVNMIKRLFFEMYQKLNSGSYHRSIFIVDRRNPLIYDDNTQYPSYTLNNKDWNDKIYCISPKQHNTMPLEYGMVPESLFCLSQQLMIPSNKQNNNTIIGIRDDLNGYMFTLSYHIYSSNTIRAYFGYGGQIQRFFMEDVGKFWPQLFVKQQCDIDKLKQYYTNFEDLDPSFIDFIEFFR